MVSSTISGWLKTILIKSGINTSTFKDHSTRSTSTCKLGLQGPSIDDISKRGSWSNKRTWRRFYNKNIVEALKRGWRIGLHVGMRFHELKFLNYVRSWSARNINPILWIKLEEDLILPALPQPLQEVIFNLFNFFSLASHGSYGRRCLRGNTDLIWVKEHYIFIKVCLYLFYSFLG